ncbi:hypothetical protein GRX03_00910 [Halovenus sp. WSH3]|uniref:Uncharacterized protein n=1 Tax=Halovenus carboxidivorans TaxID=2692199 RepID=A0A6B0T5K1_9EURY|nr:hypothetical protein [Halovenus carboxidivorans]MXR50170.1 hypothetical protein [Halovenus carboxidivorans]
MFDKLDPKVSAALSFPALVIVSLPFAYITGAFAIILSDQIFAPGGFPTTGIGYGVGITIGLLFAFWGSYGMFKLASEVQNEPGADSVSA